MAKTTALTCTLDQARDIGHHEFGIGINAHYTEIGFQGSEGIVGNLGLGSRHHTDQRALTNIGKSHEGHVGHELHFQSEPTFLTVLTLLSKARGPTPVGEEAGIAPTPATTGGCKPTITVVQQLS